MSRVFERADMRFLILDSAKRALPEMITDIFERNGCQIVHERVLSGDARHIDWVLSADVGAGAAQAAKRGAEGFVWLVDQPSATQVIEAMRQGASDVWPQTQAHPDEWSDRLQSLQKRHRNKMRHVAIDPVSGTGRHPLFHENLHHAVKSARENSRPLSVLLLDIDGFSSVNEVHSYHLGDQVLWSIGQLLLSASPESQHHHLVARLGADRFAMALLDTDKRDAAVLANRLRKQVQNQDFPGGASQTVSIGVASLSDGATEQSALLHMADIALQGAKRRGRNRVMTYAPLLEENAPQAVPSLAVEIEMLNALEESIERNLFRSVYQPIVDAKTMTPYAFEALCRPTHAAFPGPYRLFQIAERAGRIVELGRATRHLAVAVIDQLPEHASLFINLHPRELTRELETELTSLLADRAHRIVLEVTESAELPDTDFHRELIRRLKRFGFRVALDDLGAGYAGLNSLATLEPDIVKLDMELVRGIDQDKRSARLVRHIIDFANEENILVVAEGVETREEVLAAMSLGCHLLQGYWFAKPGPPFPAITTDI